MPAFNLHIIKMMRTRGLSQPVTESMGVSCEQPLLPHYLHAADARE